MTRFKTYCPICKGENFNPLSVEHSIGALRCTGTEYLKINDVKCMNCNAEYSVELTDNYNTKTLNEYLKSVFQKEV